MKDQRIVHEVKIAVYELQIRTLVVRDEVLNRKNYNDPSAQCIKLFAYSMFPWVSQRCFDVAPPSLPTMLFENQAMALVLPVMNTPLAACLLTIPSRTPGMPSEKLRAGKDCVGIVVNVMIANVVKWKDKWSMGYVSCVIKC